MPTPSATIERRRKILTSLFLRSKQEPAKILRWTQFVGDKQQSEEYYVEAVQYISKSGEQLSIRLTSISWYATLAFRASKVTVMSAEVSASCSRSVSEMTGTADIAPFGRLTGVFISLVNSEYLVDNA